MKQFFEQYGGVALGILALLVLIAMITPVGNIIKTSLQGTVQTFSTKMNDQTDTMTESMSAAFINATDFTGAKDGKYYAHGQIVANTTLPNGTNRGTEGWRLSDKQYKTIQDNLSLVLNDDYAMIFHDYHDAEVWAWYECVYIFNIDDQNDYYAIHPYNDFLRDCNDNPIQFQSKEDVIVLKSSFNTSVDGYIGFYDNLYSRDRAEVPVTNICETLNLGCEAN